VPLQTLTIEFGGLCLFVSRTTPDDGLFVLMPDMTTDADSHCPMLLVPTPVKGQAVLYPMYGEDINLAGLARFLPSPPSTPLSLPWALDVTKYANARVADCWFTGKPQTPLAARVKLPKAVVIQPAGDPAIIAVDPRGVNNPRFTVTGHGRTQVTMNLVGFNDTTLQIGPATLDATTPTLTVYLVNIQRCDIKTRKPRPHFRGQRLTHQDCYYRLLEPCPHGASGPRFWVAAPPLNPEQSECRPLSCVTEPILTEFVPPPTVHAEWVDTHDCTIGTGS